MTDYLKLERELAALDTKVTPGDWSLQGYGDDGAPTLVIHSNEVSRVCFMATPGSHGDPATIEADAGLIVSLRNSLPDIRRALRLAAVVEEAERCLTLLCAMMDDAMSDAFRAEDGPEYVPGESDVEIIPDGTFRLSDARASLARIKEAREG